MSTAGAIGVIIGVFLGTVLLGWGITKLIGKLRG